MKHKVQVIYANAIDVVLLRHRGPYEEIGAKFDELSAWAEANGVRTHRVIGIYYDNPDHVPANQLNSAACLEVSTGFQIPDRSGLNLEQATIRGGEYATLRFTGPYDELGPVWTEFTTYIENDLNRTIRDDQPAFEVYVNDASETPADQLITDLYMPLV